MDAQETPTPCVLILGHSFIRRLRHFIENRPEDLDLLFYITRPANLSISWHGVGGRTVAKTIKYDLHVVQSLRPNIVIVQLGTNDLASCSPLQVGSELEEFVRLLHDSYGVQFVCVCQTIRRRSAPEFNKNVNILTRYLRVVLEPIPYALYWGHRGFWKARGNFLSPDGVHLNSRGQHKLYRSLRGAVLQSLRFHESVDTQ